MTSNNSGYEIAIPQPAEVAAASNGADIDSWVTVVQEISKLASIICDTDFVPKNYRGNAPAATAAMLTGRELGLPPMTSLRHVQVVEGSPSLSAEYKRARVLAAGHEFNVLERTATRCKVSGRRRGSSRPPVEFEFTIEDARTARLVKDRGAYHTRPRRMLFARASTDLCDALFPDITNGLPTTELLEQDDDGASGYDEQPAPRGRVTADDLTGGRAASETIIRRLAAPQAASPAAEQGTPVPAEPHAPAEHAGEAPEDTDYGSPGTAITAQLAAIWTILTTVFKFSSDEKDQARAVCGHILGHELTSTKNMSKIGAGHVLDTLGAWRAEADTRGVPPRDFLISAMAAEAGDRDE